MLETMDRKERCKNCVYYGNNARCFHCTIRTDHYESLPTNEINLDDFYKNWHKKLKNSSLNDLKSYQEVLECEKERLNSLILNKGTFKDYVVFFRNKRKRVTKLLNYSKNKVVNKIY